MVKNNKPRVSAGKHEEKSLGLFSLTALVVGSVVGSGVFSLMNQMAASSGLMGVLIGWLITGIGMTFLVLTFRNLNKKKPNLEAGIYSYASDGFGRFMGFSSAWGYWISAWIGNVAYATMAFSALSYFFPVFYDATNEIGGQNLPSIIGASIVLWGGQYLIMHGIKSASFLNSIATIAKIVPITIFIFAIFAAFKLDIFTLDIWGETGDLGSLFDQVKGIMMATVFAFIGIEGAVIYSGRAKNRADVARASFLGLYTIIAIYMLITVLSLGVMARPELAGVSDPGMAAVLESIVGEWGAILVNIGVIVSILGAWLAWTLFAIELPYRAAKDGTFPAIFAKTNERGVPVVALMATGLLVQAFLFTFLYTDYAYNFTYSLATSTILIPYILTALYQIKISLKEKEGTKGRNFNIFVGVVAAIYGGWLVYAAGLDYLLLTSIVYGLGAIVYVVNRIMSGKKPLTVVESLIAVAIIAIGIYAIQQIATGQIQI